MDFISDQLFNGRKFRTLTIVDAFSREALPIEVMQRLEGEHIVTALNRLRARRRAPKYLFVKNGSAGHTFRRVFFNASLRKFLSKVY